MAWRSLKCGRPTALLAGHLPARAGPTGCFGRAGWRQRPDCLGRWARLVPDRAIGHQHSVGGQVAGGAAHQCHTAFPGRNVDHVGAVNQVKRVEKGSPSLGHCAWVTSSRSGGNTCCAPLCAHHPEIDANRSSCQSVGCQRQPAGRRQSALRAAPCHWQSPERCHGGEQRLQRREDGALVALSGGAVGPWRCLHKMGLARFTVKRKMLSKIERHSVAWFFSGPAAHVPICLKNVQRIGGPCKSMTCDAHTALVQSYPQFCPEKNGITAENWRVSTGW